MTKKVLDVGNCAPDYAAIQNFLTNNFDCEVLQANQLSDTMTFLQNETIDLVLINRKLDLDYSDGIEILKEIKSDDTFGKIPTMLITNFSEHQDAAEELGAVRGFGKLQYDDPETYEKLAAILK